VSCDQEIMQLHVRIADLEAQVESLQNKWATRPLSSEDQARRIEELEAALREIAAFPPGDFRPLADEVKIWKVASEALGVPQTETLRGVPGAPMWVDDDQGNVVKVTEAETKGEQDGK
jgi:hypothetical protein